MDKFSKGYRVVCQPSGVPGVVYIVGIGVIYVKLGKGEIITSPPEMLDLVEAVTVAALHGPVTCWKCGAELPEIGDVCSVCGESQIPF
jgi:hypothetical protein